MCKAARQKARCLRCSFERKIFMTCPDVFFGSPAEENKHEAFVPPNGGLLYIQFISHQCCPAVAGSHKVVQYKSATQQCLIDLPQPGPKKFLLIPVRHKSQLTDANANVYYFIFAANLFYVYRTVIHGLPE